MASTAAVGFFSGVWSRLRAAASAWRRSENDDDADDGQNEETVRSRLVRRAAAARRLAQKLAFVSINLEVLVFVYAFWRARRRNLSWRQPIQALPVLVIPALATLIYAAFIRFTTRLNLKDHRRLKRLQEEKQANDCESSKFNQNDLISSQNCNDVADASNSLPATDSNSTSLPATHSVNITLKPRKRRQPSIGSRADGEIDLSWGHSKDFQPMPSDGLRKRRFSSEKTCATNSSATVSIEEKIQDTMPSNVADSSCGEGFPEFSESNIVYSQANNIKPSRGSSAPLISYQGILPTYGNEEVPAASTHIYKHGGAHDSTKDTVYPPLDYRNHSGPVISVKLAEPPTIHHESPIGGDEDRVFGRLMETVNTNFSSSKDNLIRLVKSHDTSFDRGDSCLPEHGIPSLSTVFRELPVKVSKENSPSQPEKLEPCPVSIKEAPASPSNYTVAHSSLNDMSPNSSDPGLSASENFVKVPPEWSKEESFLEPHKPAARQSDTFAPEKIPTLHAIDGNGVIINSDEDTSALAYTCSNANINEAIVNIDTSSCRLNLPAFQQLHREEVEDPEVSFSSSAEVVMKGDEDAIEKEPCGFEAQEGNGTSICLQEEALLGPFVVSATEQYLETLGFPSCHQDDDMMEFSGIVAGNPELNNPTSRELFKDSDEVSMEELSYDLHLKEQNNLPFNLEKEDFLDPPVVDIAEHSLATFSVEEISISPEEHINSEKYSFYSRSSSCISEVNMGYAPGDGASSKPENSHIFSFDEQKTMMVHSVNSAENYGNNTMPAEFIPETNVIETLDVAGEAMAGLLHEVSSNTVDAFVTPDIGNGMGKSDDYLDLLSSSSAHTIEDFKAENNPYKMPMLYSADANLIGCLGGVQQETHPQQEETALCFDNLCMTRQDENSENSFTNLRSQDMPDDSVSEILQVEEILSSDSLHDGIFSPEGTLISLDDGNNADSPCVLHDTQINRNLLGLQEGSLKPQAEHTMNSISRNEVHIAKRPACNISEESMVADLQDTNKTPSEPRDEFFSSFSGACNFLDDSKGSTNHPYYSRSASPRRNLIKIPEAVQGETVEPDDKNFYSFEETLTPGYSSNSPRSSYNCKQEAVGSSEKGLAGPLLVDVHSFDMIAASEERENKSLTESAHSSDETSIIQAEVKYAENFLDKLGLFSYAQKDNCIVDPENFDRRSCEPQYQEGPEIAVSLAGMPLLVDIDTENEKGHDSTRCSPSQVEFNILEDPLQELSIDAGNKVLPKGAGVHEWHATDKEPKDSRLDDVKEDLKESDEDHESSPVNPPEVAESTPAHAPMPSVKLNAKDASWRDSAMGVSNSFEVAQSAGLRQRKQVFTISNITESSTVAELVDGQSTELVDNVVGSLSAPLPPSAAPSIEIDQMLSIGNKYDAVLD
uniref:Uncharacterized protein n=1 Tax=Leersia perrieri TaxID=77586 RepID=A0A0D9VN12_9ORYZ